MVSNVVVILCDTLRKDVLDIYGGKAKMKFLSKFLRDSVLYNNAVSPSSWTFPSHVSLFTGLYLNEHGVHERSKTKSRGEKLMDLRYLNGNLKAERLSEYFKSSGYTTLGFSNNRMVSNFNNFGIGFDTFISFDPLPPTKSRQIVLEASRISYSPFKVLLTLLRQGNFRKIFDYLLAYYQSERLKKDLDFPMDKGARYMIELLKALNMTDKSFLFINLMEMHDPYKKFSLNAQWNDFTGIKSISNRKINFFKRQYVLEAEYLDSVLQQIISILKSKMDYDNSMIIITSDHGQAFKEHNYFLHGDYVYNELVEVPLIIKYPNNRKFKPRKGYQSLVNIKKHIRDVIEGEISDTLTTETAFSETYGLMFGLPKHYEHRRDYVERVHDKLRKAVFKNGFKLSVNGTDGVVEEFLKNGKEVEINDYKDEFNDLLNELDIFKGNEDFKLPENR